MAQIGKPHGVRGEVYVVPISDDPDRFRPGSRLQTDGGETLIVESCRRHRARTLVRFEGVNDREGADALRGALYVPAASARALEPDEYWPHDLEGCSIVDASGTERGTLSKVIPGAAHDLLAVQTPEGDRLIPMVKDIVVDVDLDGRRIVVDPPEGLLDP